MRLFVQRFVLVAAGFALPSLGFFSAAAPALAGILEIHAINVQFGTSTLVIGPDGTTVLLDAGGNGKGNTQIRPYLMRPDVGVMPAGGFTHTLASHLHADHVGGFDDLLAAALPEDRYDVTGTNWYNGSSYTSGTVTDYWVAAQGTSAGTPVPIPLGHVILLGDGATLEVLAVAGEVIGHGTVGTSDENDESVAVLITYGAFSFLWAGDLGGGQWADDFVCTGRETGQTNLESPLAQAIAPGGAAPRLSELGVDVLHVSHHGSESSTNHEWMNLLRPEIAILSVGENAYGLPRQAVVETVLGAVPEAQGECVTAPPALVLQTEEGDLTDPDPATSYAAYSVGDVRIFTDGRLTYLVDATGEVVRGPDERSDAGLSAPVEFLLDETVFFDGFESGDLSAWTQTAG